MKDSSTVISILITDKPIAAPSISRFDISAWLRRPGLVDSICRVHVRREYALAIGATHRDRFERTQCACANNASNRLIVRPKRHRSGEITNKTFKCKHIQGGPAEMH